MNTPNMPAVYGNQQLLSELRTMRKQNHLPHALLLHGERGCGKKLIAKWFAMLVLCENADSAPCGTCKSCRLAAEDAHPDITTAEHSGKRMGFSVETVRDIRREASVLPNNGDMRVFIFPDADGMSIQAQNALLKSVEEPPAHSCFVFTAGSVGVLLPTLLSRMTAKAVFPVTAGECTEALLKRDYPDADIRAAAARFGGNIGKCIAYLSDPAVKRAADDAAALSAALAERNEYEMLRLLTAAAADKDQLIRTLELLDAQVRDAAVLTLEGSFPRLGCDRAAAETLSSGLTPRRAMRMHGAIREAFADLDGNVSAVLTATALCAALCDA
ncbi:MAG: hypothetical protein IKX57_03095 [Oscillospiraceae bacterium]|nr:hypothetical protein [Oscillospiraceae bacterium]MBR5722588.1 hypothetical protein [Oscillospiraceae bacterium]